MEEINRDCSKCYKLYSSCGWFGKGCQYKDNPEKLKQLKHKEKENDKLKQALKKIKGIANTRNYLNLDEALDDILQIISEVEK